MTVRRSVVMATGLCLVFAGAMAALAAEKQKEPGKHECKAQTITAENIPVSAREALTKLAGSATIEKYEQMGKEGMMVYKAEWKVDGREHGAAVAADGTLVARAEQVLADNVPTAVKDAAAKLLPNATNVTYEKKTFVMYKIEGKVGEKEEKALVFPTGQEHWKGKEHKEKAAKAAHKAK